jgi:Domain of unknown function (DUF5348)
MIIVDKNYLKARDEMSCIKDKLDNLLKEAKTKSFEDEIVYNYMYGVIENLETVIEKIDHFSKPTIEGTLREAENGKFELFDEMGKHIRCFSCASSIECYVEYDGEMQWVAGRVEHTTRNGESGYYFLGADKPFLYTGMKARIRTE